MITVSIIVCLILLPLISIFLATRAQGADVERCRAILRVLSQSDRRLTGLEIVERLGDSSFKGVVYVHTFRMEKLGLVERSMADTVSTNGVDIHVPVPMHTFAITERGRKYLAGVDDKSHAAFDEEFMR